MFNGKVPFSPPGWSAFSSHRGADAPALWRRARPDAATDFMFELMSKARALPGQIIETLI
jgi:hypothetical protein